MGSNDQEQPAALDDSFASPTRPLYVVEAMRGLTPTQKKYVMDGSIHGDCTVKTIRALQDKALFFLMIDSPNGRCGFMKLTPLGETVRRILLGTPT